MSEIAGNQIAGNEIAERRSVIDDSPPVGESAPAEIESRGSRETASDGEGELAAAASVEEAQRSVVREPAPGESGTNLWLRRGDQLFVGACAMAAVVLMIGYWLRLSGGGLEPVEIDRLPENRYAFRLDVNSATWVEWAQLDGIGDTLAHRIVADREQRGDFRSIEDIRRVKGIGPKTLDRIRPWLELRPESKQR